MPDERNKTGRYGFALVLVLFIVMAIAVLSLGFFVEKRCRAILWPEHDTQNPDGLFG